MGLRRWGLVAALVVTVGAVAACGDDSVNEVRATGVVDAASTVTTQAVPTSDTLGPGETAGEIFLEGAGTPGPDSFTGEVFAAPVVDTAAPVTSTRVESSTTTAEGGQVVVAGRSGNTPGIYGGTRDDARCDPQQILGFLQSNPGQAEAWVAAQNTDESLRWGDGRTDLQVADLDAFFAELTPVTLVEDTRVTNNGYRDGRPTPRQSVLQAGTAVLVDVYGIPRARCACGNPLTPPRPSPVTPTYAGDSWAEFNPEHIVVMQPAPEPLETLVLTDLATGGPFERPIGSVGGEDSGEVSPTAGSVIGIPISGTVPSGPGFAIDAIYDTATTTVKIDPAEVEWIAISGLDHLEDTPSDDAGTRAADGVPDIVFGNIDDYVVVTVTKVGGIDSGPYVMHDNDAMGVAMGNQAVIYGSYPSVWYVASIDWSTDPASSTVLTSPETGDMNSWFRSQGVGEYEFEVSFVNVWTERAGHGETYLLIGY